VKNRLIGLTIATMMLAPACSDGGASATTTPTTTAAVTTSTTIDASPGAVLYNEPIRGFPSCLSCHVSDRDLRTVGPSVIEMARDAGRRIPAMSGDEYLRESILEPDAYVLDGFREGEMPIAELTGAEVDLLVDYILRFAP